MAFDHQPIDNVLEFIHDEGQEVIEFDHQTEEWVIAPIPVAPSVDGSATYDVCAGDAAMSYLIYKADIPDNLEVPVTLRESCRFVRHR